MIFLDLKLIKKSPSRNNGDDNTENKNNNLINALNSPRAIVELKEHKIDEKREIFHFNQNALELGLKQKKKIKGIYWYYYK